MPAEEIPTTTRARQICERFAKLTPLIVMILAGFIIVPRSRAIARMHSESVDDQYHLLRGVQYWTGEFTEARFNDPPLGEALSALPLAIAGVRPQGEFHLVLYGQHYTPEKLLEWVAIWKSILFLPMIGVVFVWVRRIYNARAAWLAAILLAFEPNFASFIPSPAIDVLGVEGIVIACWLAWRYFERPTIGRLIAASVGLAGAILLKHTADVLPAAIVIFAVVHIIRAWKTPPSSRLRFVLKHSAIALVVFAIAFWGFLRFSISPPRLAKEVKRSHPTWVNLSTHSMPAGVYVGSVVNALSHADRGHSAYLLGKRSQRGWWSYFPILATYKIPLAVAALLVVSALVSFWLAPPRWEELAFLVPLIIWAVFVISSRINTGWRHFLPAYLFLILLGCRFLMIRPKHWWPGIVAIIPIAGLAVDSVKWHPDYLSYINYPRAAAYLDISDSNLDWGQGLAEVRRWIDQHKTGIGKRTVSLGYVGRPEEPNVEHYLGNRVTRLDLDSGVPTRGILILSPTWLVNVYGGSQFAYLQKVQPSDVIGNSMLVYDLDHHRPPPRVKSATTTSTASPTTAPTTKPAVKKKKKPKRSPPKI